MKTIFVPLAVIGAIALGSTRGSAGAAEVGSPLPPAELDGFALTEARSLDDFVGRTLLIEFFAYW